MARPRVLIVGAGFAGFHCAPETAGKYLSAAEARQTAERILARDQEGWLT